MGNCNGRSRNGFWQHYISNAAGFKPQKKFFSILHHLSAIFFSLFFLAGTSLAETYVNGNITSDTTWGVDGSPYIVTGDITVRHSSATHYNIQTTAVLTIEPGVVVRFEPGTGLYVGLDNTSSSTYDYYGALSAQGTADLPVVFTSNAPTPAPGDWKGIYFSNFTHDSDAMIEHVIVEYGGNSHNANIYCASASPTIKNSTIRNSSSHGIYVDGGSSPLIADNLFTGNNDSPINIHALKVYRLSGNSGSDNGKDYIEVRGAEITSNSTWSQQGFPYVITGDVTVRHSSATHYNIQTTAVLTIEPGVVVRFEPGTGLYVGLDNTSSSTYDYYGALSAQGTADLPVVFTSNAPT
ncbi:MAG: right-handed parallel beta-helix repeat-containing protein, partial [Anaerolineales bacterium]